MYVPEILSAAKNDTPRTCHSERSEESLGGFAREPDLRSPEMIGNPRRIVVIAHLMLYNGVEEMISFGWRKIHMPRDERKRQKALMKKRSKQKAAAQSRARHEAMTLFSEKSLIRRAREFPILECRISADWEKEYPGLVQVLVARQQPDDNICYGFYLVDKYLLGLKNSLAHADVPLAEYRNDIREGLYHDTKSMDCPPELAHQLIYQSIDYAQQFGFSPEKDFALNQYILEPRSELDEPYNITFGRNGKPFFVAGPRDNVPRILRQLEKTAGPGNFDYVAVMGDMDVFF